MTASHPIEPIAAETDSRKLDALQVPSLHRSVEDPPGDDHLDRPVDLDCQQTKMQVAHISLGTGMGGMEKLLYEFARHRDRERFELSFLSLQHRGCLAAELEAQDCRVFDYDKADGLLPKLVFRLASRLRRIGADVVHTHNTAAMVYGVPAARFAGIGRIVHTCHGQRVNATRRQTQLFRFLSRFTTRVVCVSDDSRNRLVEDGVSRHRTTTIVNGIDLDQYSFQRRCSDGPAIVVARLSPEKDLATLLSGVATANRKSGRQQPLQLNIVGDGPLRNDLEQLSRKLQLQDVVHFLGRRNDVNRLLAQSSMYVLPSLTEGISLTLLEAMASGVPVITTDVGGNPEVVHHMSSGLLVPAGDCDSLAAAMIRLSLDSELANRLALTARKEVERRFDVKRMVGQYQSLYLEKSIV